MPGAYPKWAGCVKSEQPAFCLRAQSGGRREGGKVNRIVLTLKTDRELFANWLTSYASDRQVYYAFPTGYDQDVLYLQSHKRFLGQGSASFESRSGPGLLVGE